MHSLSHKKFWRYKNNSEKQIIYFRLDKGTNFTEECVSLVTAPIQIIEFNQTFYMKIIFLRFDQNWVEIWIWISNMYIGICSVYINERELCRKKISVKHGSGQSAESNNPYHTRFNMQAAQAVHENVSNLKKPWIIIYLIQYVCILVILASIVCRFDD